MTSATAVDGLPVRLSLDDLSRLIDAVEGTAHLDTTTEEQQHTDQLLHRLVTAFQNHPTRQTSLFQ